MNSLISSLPVLIIYPHSRCNCRCAMCDIWKHTTKAEFGVEELERRLHDLVGLSVRWVVLSGGEPLMHSQFARFCRLLRSIDTRITLLSTGLLLARKAAEVVDTVDDAIVSLDGPRAVHDEIRGVTGAFDQLGRGVSALRALRPEFPIAARSTVQRANHHCLRQTAAAAKDMGLDSISFLAADVTSEAFNRPGGWAVTQQNRIALSRDELAVLDTELDGLWREWGQTGFVRESRQKLGRIALHFSAHLGLAQPIAPRCNAPWASTVIETDGTVRPCFFHRPVGKLGKESLFQVLNSSEAESFRRNLDISTNPICRRCVCSLNLTN